MTAGGLSEAIARAERRLANLRRRRERPGGRLPGLMDERIARAEEALAVLVRRAREGGGGGGVTLHVGDCLEVLAELPECSVDACITDPPYHLTSIVRRFGGPDAKGPTAPVYQRSVGGFMGQTWDGGDLSFRPETWAAVLRVLKPGGALLAMGATRGWHRTAVAIEDAGFDIRDSVCWIYGTGFPKSHNGPWGGTALKPAWEPVVVARRPLDGTHAANWERWGTGGLDVDAMRVPLNGEKVERGGRHPIVGRFCEPGKGAGRSRGEETDMGRWPRNVAHDGSEAVLGEFPEDGRGSAARFFYCAKPSRAEKEAGLDGLDEVAPHLVQGRSEGSAGSENPRAGIRGAARRCTHPTVKPIELFRWLIRGFARPGGLVLDPFLGSGTTAIAALMEGRRWIGIEREPEYAAIARARIEWWARECARKPGRSVAEVLGESRPVRAAPEAEPPSGAVVA